MNLKPRVIGVEVLQLLVMGVLGGLLGGSMFKAVEVEARVHQEAHANDAKDAQGARGAKKAERGGLADGGDRGSRGDRVEFPPAGYRLAFEDDFAGGLNRERWSTELKVFGRMGDRYHNASYLNYLSDDDVLVDEGRLRLRSDRRTVVGDNPHGVYEYSSGMVSSHDRFAFAYGYIEIKARFPGGPGVWPAFWLMPQTHEWPPEFDVAEYYGGRKLMHLGLCYGQFPEINWDSGGNSDVDFEGTWNTYGLLWLPGKVQWIQNGVVKREVTGPHVPEAPMYIILSNGVSSRIGPSGAPTEQTVFPNYLEVEYVRVWTAPESRLLILNSGSKAP